MSNPLRVAVLGSNISAAALARRLSCSKATIEVELFKHVFDPARSIFDRQPLCDYQSPTLIARDEDPVCFQEELALWQKQGLVQELGSHDWRVGRLTATDTRELKPVPLLPGARRFQAKEGGLFSLCDQAIASLKGIPVHQNVISIMKPEVQTKKWILTSINNESFGPYDLVLLCMDHNPRNTRRAGYKQLLERNFSCGADRVAACVARSLMCTSMGALVEFPPGTKAARALAELDYDSFMVDGVPEIATAVRRDRADLEYRQQVSGGKGAVRNLANNTKLGSDVWSLISTRDWSYALRPTHSGKWDKAAVGHDMVKAFLRDVVGLRDVQGIQPGKDYKFVTPTFHWTGASSINQIAGEPLIFDAEAGLGYLGDCCAGVGPVGGVKSAEATARHVEKWCEAAGRGSRADLESLCLLPMAAERWTARIPRADEDCSASIHGLFTGRKERTCDLDWTWEPAALMNQALLSKSIREPLASKQPDSLSKYRHRPGARSQLERDREMDVQMANAEPEETTAASTGGNRRRIYVQMANAEPEETTAASTGGKSAASIGGNRRRWRPKTNSRANW